MARKPQTGDASDDVVALSYPDATRKNIPPAGIESRGKVDKVNQIKYAYNPHLPPVLRFDETGQADQLPELIEIAGRRALTAEEQQTLASALRNHEPWLEWTGKREQPDCVVDPVGLHIHERVSTKAILATAARQDIARSLFADPEQDYREAVQFYQHDVNWSNRLILGDSLAVMASLARREALAGKVQMIYIDPPYGINYASNFQAQVGTMTYTDKDADLTREPEMIKAFRDTWTLGLHSYLSYLRDRITLAREMLTDSGSLFVQISDENKHRVRALLDGVFGPENYCVEIAYVKTAALGSALLYPSFDTILWYAKDKEKVKYRQLYKDKEVGGEGADQYRFGLTQAGWTRNPASEGDRPYTKGDTTSQSGGASNQFKVAFEGRGFSPAKGGWKSGNDGMIRLAGAARIATTSNSLRYVRFVDDFAAFPLNSLWEDTGGGAGANKVYVVQSGTKAIQRCLLMTTDPGDLVLDPTCGSGTTAYVAEQWGRRWITIDCSRVALAIARQRLLTAKFDFYSLRPLSAQDLERNPRGTWLADPTGNVSAPCTFACKTVPHITLKSIARNQSLDPIFAKWDPILAEKLVAANEALARANTAELRSKLAKNFVDPKKKKSKNGPITEAEERRWNLPPELPGRDKLTEVPKDFAGWYDWEIPFDSDPDYPAALNEAITAYRTAWRGKMDEVNACIDASADQEELIDQPEVEKGILRVCSPFTVEGVIPSEESIDLEPGSVAPDHPSPMKIEDGHGRGEPPLIGGAPEDLETFGNQAEDSAPSAETEPQNAETFRDSIVKYLRADGVLFPNNNRIKFDRLESSEIQGIDAEGVWTSNEEEKRVAVVVGPQYGALSAKMVEDAIRIGSRRGFDEMVFAGFNFDGAAQAAIQDDPDPNLRIHMAQIRPDVNMGPLLKTTNNSQLFTVSGAPRTKLEKLPNDEFKVTVEGVDIYDPITGVVHSTKGDKIAAWFLDSDYDGRSFCITQAFFPDAKAWEKLSKALSGTVDKERFETFAGQTSLPFKLGKNARVAVKVIDPRGNEVVRVHRLEGYSA